MVSVCTTCKGLQRHLKTFNGGEQEPESTSSIWLSTTLPSLRESSGGCRACTLLLQGILLHHDRFANVRPEDVRVFAESFNTNKAAAGKDAQGHLSVEVRWKTTRDACCEDDDHMREDGYPDLKLEFFTDRDGQSPFSAIRAGRHISDNPIQDAGLSTARCMISECLSKHSKCRKAQSTTLPKRVLDVLLEDGSKGIKLHESIFDDVKQRYELGEYLTLSHCWGTGRGVLKTTTKTLQSHRNNIPWASLPRKFQEAVALTRSLGFRWLWIDSLCIVQDDVSDKLTESFKLDEIFQNSFLTIAATSATDSNGLFLPKQQLFKLQATDSKGSASKIYVREQPTHYSFKAPFNEGSHMNDWELPFDPFTEANLHAPLLKRAWAYAERLLSVRVLHFTSSEMILECREGYQCECGRIDDSTYDSRTTDCVKQEYARIVSEASSSDEEMTDELGYDKRTDRADSLASQLAATSISDVTESLARKRAGALQLWSYTITEYTSRDLTYDVDRLVAIAGVARTLLDTFQSGYIAGQWTFSTLGLLWYPSDGGQCHRPQIAGYIPSWSWASVEGSPIYFDNSTAMDLACRASFASERTSKPVWLPTGSDTLELTAAMATEVTFRVDNPTEYSLVKDGVSVDFKPDIIPLRGDDALSSGESLVCVLASMTYRSSIIGLVLKQSRSDPQMYRRVGRFECYDCQVDDTDEEPEDAEALFGYWFPQIEDMTQLDDGPKRTFFVI